MEWDPKELGQREQPEAVERRTLGGCNPPSHPCFQKWLSGLEGGGSERVVHCKNTQPFHLSHCFQFSPPRDFCAQPSQISLVIRKVNFF